MLFEISKITKGQFWAKNNEYSKYNQAKKYLVVCI